jgi:periplasmic protein TonB
MTAIRSKPLITAGDRLGLTLFLAIAFHALVLLGVSFSFDSKPKPQVLNTLDITLVDTRTDKAPKNPDYLAQENQAGGGNTAKRVRHTAPKTNPSPVQTPGVADQSTPPTTTEPPADSAPRILTSQHSKTHVQRSEPRPKAQVSPQLNVAQLMRRSAEIARLEARNDRLEQTYAKRPDPKYLYANTRRYQDAAYLNGWTRKVEKIGNINYPDEAQRRNLSGSLILEVVLRPDGALRSVQLLRSSGHKVLDDAAIRIVRLAAPFAPVPADVLDGKNELRIVRVWMFTTGNELISR